MNEFERLVGGSALHAAWQAISGRKDHPGSDGISLAAYAKDADHNLDRLRFALRSGLYRPCEDKRVELAGREISISCVEDKIVQTAMATILRENTVFPESAHGFVKGRSVHTAYAAIEKGLADYREKTIIKTDIKRFFESLDHGVLMERLREVAHDEAFIGLVRLMLNGQERGVAAGSALSPILSNIYLMEFDESVGRIFPVYVRYVDDIILMLPSQMGQGAENAVKAISVVEHLLASIGLCVSREKTQIIDGHMPFFYLGQPFNQTPPRHDEVEALIARGNYADAELLLESNAEEPVEETPPTLSRPYTASDAVPPHILAVEQGCGFIRAIALKAAREGYLNLQERKAVQFSFSCLGDEGRKHIHRLLSSCIDYDYQLTAHEIESGAGLRPVGCRKMFTRFDGQYEGVKCSCVFQNQQMYPSPVCHALDVDPSCYAPPAFEERLGHMRPASPKTRIEELISKYAELTKQIAEIRVQESICSEQMDLLFEKNGLSEADTGHGKVIRAEDGYYLKLG